jgi:hypothetical protein
VINVHPGPRSTAAGTAATEQLKINKYIGGDVMQDIPLIQRVIAVLWPAFLTSGAATILFFTAFDPQHLLMDTQFADMGRLGAYTLGFFLSLEGKWGEGVYGAAVILEGLLINSVTFFRLTGC